MRVARSVSVACLLAGASAARAEGFSAVLAPGASETRLSRTDETGRTTTQDVTDLVQQYTLSLDRKLYPNVGFSGTALLSKDLTWTRDPSGTTTRSDQTAGTLSTRLGAGNALLGGAVSYDRRQERVSFDGGPGWAVGNTYAASVGWHPLDLPTLDLRVTRTDVHDPSRPGDDATALDGLFSLGYQGIPGLDVRYTLRFDDATTPATETRSVGQDVRATYRTTLLDGRTNAYVSGGVTTLWSETLTGAGATVEAQRFPIAGLSLIEDFPALPETDQLLPTPRLVNGDVRESTSVNLGYAVGPADRRPRDLGVQLADAVTTVNRIRVWVDQPLPAAVSSAFTWDAWRSDDGQHWTPVAIVGPVTFGTLENRFEIPIAETAAPYLKVVTRPLDASATTDPRWQNVWVTELQIFGPAPHVSATGTTRFAETVNAAAQTRLLSAPNLSHDVAVTVSNSGAGAPTTWSVVNGLSLLHRATPRVTLQARVARQDSDAGTGHVGSDQWSATVAHQPLPTVADGLTYSGQLAQAPTGTTLMNSVSGYGRAQIYKGVAATTNATYTLTDGPGAASARSASANVGSSIVPNRMLSLGATYGLSRTESWTASGATGVVVRQLADASAAFTPVPAVYATAGVTRVFGDVRPTTTARTALNLTPFPDGQLMLRFTYADTYDTASDSRTQLLSPSLRWTVRPGAFLDLVYTDIRTRAAVEASRIQTASLNLTISL